MQCSAVVGSETVLIKGECVQKLFIVNMMIPLQPLAHGVTMNDEHHVEKWGLFEATPVVQNEHYSQLVSCYDKWFSSELLGC